MPCSHSALPWARRAADLATRPRRLASVLCRPRRVPTRPLPQSVAACRATEGKPPVRRSVQGPEELTGNRARGQRHTPGGASRRHSPEEMGWDGLAEDPNLKGRQRSVTAVGIPQGGAPPRQAGAPLMAADRPEHGQVRHGTIAESGKNVGQRAGFEPTRPPPEAWGRTVTLSEYNRSPGAEGPSTRSSPRHLSARLGLRGKHARQPGDPGHVRMQEP